MPRTARKTRRPAFACGFAIALLTALVWLSWPRERLLLALAHPIVAVDTGLDATSARPKQTVYWLTASKLLILTTEQGGQVNHAAWHGYAELFDALEKKRTRLTALNTLLSR